MTNAFLYKSSRNGEILGFKVCDHAGFAEAGQDIVCAAISVLTINTINAIDLYTNARYSLEQNEEQATIKFMLAKRLFIRKDVRILLNALELGLSKIAADNPEYLSITVEEV